MECYQDRAAQDNTGSFRELRLLDKLSISIQFGLGFPLKLKKIKRKTRESQFQIEILI